MNRLRTVPLVPAHFDLMELRERERLTLPAIMGGKLDALAIYADGLTAIADGRVIGSIGIYPMWPGTYEMWLVPSVYVAEYGLSFARFVKKALAMVESLHPITRIQTESPADELHDRWMRYLGFEQEGDLRKYINGVDYRMWAKLYG
jgi:hypothetical protein